MAKVRFDEVFAAPAPLLPYTDECGTDVGFATDYVVARVGKDHYGLSNVKWVRSEDFPGSAPVELYDAAVMAEKVRSRGVIETDHWFLLEVPEPLDEKWAPYGTAWQLEQRELQDQGYQAFAL